MTSMLIESSAELAAFCERLATEPFVTLDTEFLREKTYYPKLCLLQLGGEHEAAAIDVLAPGIDLEPLWALMKNRNVLKVMHASRQDMEVLLHDMGELPQPIYDTQIAALVCGFPESVGYETLVRSLVGVQLDKTHQFTDWSRRPLSPKQLAYAVADVVHLREIYVKLTQKIEAKNRSAWIAEELEALNDVALYQPDPQAAWQKFKPRQRHPIYLAALQAIAAWREMEARRVNQPRSWVLKDDTVAQLAVQRPTTVEDLRQMRGAPNHLKTAQMTSLLSVIADAVENPPALTLPDEQGSRLNARQEAQLQVLRLLLQLQSSAHHVAPRLVADKDDLVALLLNKADGLGLSHGWRHEVFGKEAIAWLKGETALKSDPKTGVTLAPLA